MVITAAGDTYTRRVVRPARIASIPLHRAMIGGRQEALMIKQISPAFGIAVVGAVAFLSVSAHQNSMSFFITSAGPGNGANLGGLAGADQRCQTLATAAGAGNRTWRAYLSVAAAAGQPAVNARDRIGKGPWMNVKGVVVAKSVADRPSDGKTLGGEK